MATQVILLERIEKLGAMGDIVNVKPGYARNYLLPQNKALRATDANIAYFETQKAGLEKINNEKKKAAETHAKSLKGLSVILVRQASEGGQLYGSVTARDIAEAINEVAKEKIERNMVVLNQNFKEIGLFDVVISLHSEVKETVKINIARTEDEAKKQAKTGKALIGEQDDMAAKTPANDSKADLMEEGALAAEKEAEAKAAAEEAEEKAKAEKKAEAKKAKKAVAAEEEVEASAEGSSTEEADA
ncbi:MAG: 50S ribosomal protein L9 [Alphaproteobacteria bacterium]|nr:50S ribosomal protein L9 [Alphaproteobacteria bacterium]